MATTFEMPGEQKLPVKVEPSDAELAVVNSASSDFTTLNELKKQLDSMQDLYDMVASRIIGTFQQYGVKSVLTDDCRYTLVTSGRKQYGEQVALIEEELKVAKEEAEKRGEFTVKESKPFLKVTKN